MGVQPWGWEFPYNNLLQNALADATKVHVCGRIWRRSRALLTQKWVSFGISRIRKVLPAPYTDTLNPKSYTLHLHSIPCTLNPYLHPTLYTPTPNLRPPTSNPQTKVPCPARPEKNFSGGTCPVGTHSQKSSLLRKIISIAENNFSGGRVLQATYTPILTSPFCCGFLW